MKKIMDTYHGSKFITSQLHNYSDPREELFTTKGSYKSGELHGLIQTYYSNGKLSYSGCFSNGIMTGTHTEYHDNGHIAHIRNYVNNQYHGTWKQYYNTGKLREERKYLNGRLFDSAVYEWYDNGNLMVQSSYIHTNPKDEGVKILHGLSESYYENGKLRIESHYENGKPNGEWKGFHENGNLKYIMLYENFKYISYTEYEEDGKTLKVKNNY